jgi:hypothetical protein
MTIATNRAARVLFYNISWQQFENLLKDLLLMGEVLLTTITIYPFLAVF